MKNVVRLLGVGRSEIRWTSFGLLLLVLLGALSSRPVRAQEQEEIAWPPELSGARDGTVTLRSKAFLNVPADLQDKRREPGVAEFDVAKEPPTVVLAYHGDLGPNAGRRRLWSSWGDICLASDGRAYSAIGDHADDAGGDARCFLYVWDPAKQTLEQIVDMNQVIPPREGQPAWSKVHARIDEGADGKIYFSCTLNDGKRASQPKYQWNEQLPGGQLYRYDPKTGATEVFANLPPHRCTATSQLDRARNVWWCNLEAGDGDALWGLDLNTRRQIFRAPDGSTAFNRNFAVGSDGSVYFNGLDKLWKYDASTGSMNPTRSSFGESPGMRASTRESSDNWIYGASHRDGQIFRYHTKKDRLEKLGPTWLMGDALRVAELSPDERFVYYLPGAHGGAFRYGTPVIQYEIATGRRKVLAFLAEAFEKEHGYVPAGTYGFKVSADGSALYVNFNGHAADRLRPGHMKPIGFGLCSFAEIRIPESERK